MGAPVDLDPHDALRYCVAVAAGEVRWLDERIAELTEPEVLRSPTMTVHQRIDVSGGNEPQERGLDELVETRHLPVQLHAWIQARHQALDRLQRYSSAAAKAGVQERQVRITEEMAAQIAEFGRATVRALGLDPSSPEARAAFRTALDVIDIEGAADVPLSRTTLPSTRRSR